MDHSLTSINGGLDAFAASFHEKALHAVFFINGLSPDCFRPQGVSGLCGRDSVRLLVEGDFVRDPRNILVRGLGLEVIFDHLAVGREEPTLGLFHFPGGRPFHGLCASLEVG